MHHKMGRAHLAGNAVGLAEECADHQWEPDQIHLSQRGAGVTYK
jgi:hypothetical protein